MHSQILAELKKFNRLHNDVEAKVAVGSSKAQKQGLEKKSTKTNTILYKYTKLVNSFESVSDEKIFPSIRAIRVTKNNVYTSSKGNESVIKSKRGRALDVMVKNKVAWPHEAILGGPSWQHITFDQLSPTQFVQRFSEESDQNVRKFMLRYLSK